MSERSTLLIELVGELLGPRTGFREVLPSDQNPRDEYITGVLAPILEASQREIDAEVVDIPSDADGDDDEEDELLAVPGTNPSSPSLDPKAQPKSIGISFVVADANAEATFEFCATWARGLLFDGHREPSG
jgi:hypothetical protein